MPDSQARRTEPSISIILPLFDAEGHLPAVLPPLSRALGAGDVCEVIVVDDVSTDRGPALCREAGLTVLQAERNGGPGAARNLGASQARGDIVMFVDSDVVMHDDAPSVVRDALGPESEHVAVFGCYDESPTARNVVSVYKNLLHAYTHARAAGEASTFWAGCGAVRRDAFLAVGGFDAVRFPRPSIEDIELGYRLRDAGGRILLEPRLRGTHRKRWTLGSLLRTDIFQRAVPWGRLLLERRDPGSELNVSAAERGKAVLAGLLLLAIIATPFHVEVVAVAAGLAVVAWIVNRDLFALIRRRAGLGSALAAFVLHQAYYIYATAAFVYCRLESLWRSPTPRSAPPTTSHSDD